MFVKGTWGAHQLVMRGISQQRALRCEPPDLRKGSLKEQPKDRKVFIESSSGAFDSELLQHLLCLLVHVWAFDECRKVCQLFVLALSSGPINSTDPRALRTHILRLLGPKTILYQAFGLC